jgi:hypothetical protein
LLWIAIKPPSQAANSQLGGSFSFPWPRCVQTYNSYWMETWNYWKQPNGIQVCSRPEEYPVV